MANARVHGETSLVPVEQLGQERASLQKLPTPYRGAVAAARPRAGEPVQLPARAHLVVPPQHALGVHDRLLEAL